MTEPNFQLTPNEVRGQQFGTSFRGFDRVEVESFRDRVAEELDRLAAGADPDRRAHPQRAGTAACVPRT